MTTFNSKRFAKLAGLLKENLTDRLEDATSAEAAWDFVPLPNSSAVTLDPKTLPLDPEVEAYINAHNAEQGKWEQAGKDRFAFRLDPNSFRGMTFSEFLEDLRREEARDKRKESLRRVADETEEAYKRQAVADAENEKALADLATEEGLGGPSGVEGFGKRGGKNEKMKESRKSNKKVLSSSPVSVSLKAVMKSCDHLNECGCQMQAPFDAPEDEPQGYMLVQNLKKLAAKAAELSTMANHDDDAEPWVESKVNSAAQHIDAIYDYIKYGRPSEPHMMHHEKDMPHDDFSDLDMHVVNTYEENE